MAVGAEEILFRAFGDAGAELYLVGGTVRDRLLGLPSTDLDFATGAAPEVTVEILSKSGIRTYDVGRRFGTIAAILETDGITVKAEITTFRAERYEKGSRKPRVRFGLSLEDDLMRRDFTINAIAMDGEGGLVDPCGGIADLSAGMLRTPCDPAVTMAEDPLRMLRAVRFRGRFGFALHPDLESAVRSRADSLREVSVERWLQEMDGMMGIADGRGAAACMSSLADLDLLTVVLPELAPLAGSDGEDPGEHHVEGVWSHTLCVLGNTPPRLDLRWAALFHDSGKPFRRSVDEGGSIHYHGHPETGAELALMAGGRLRFPRARRLSVSSLVRLHQRPAEYRSEWSDSAVRRLARDAGAFLADLLTLSEADSECRERTSARRRLALLRELRTRLSPDMLERRLVPEVVGDRLRALLGPARGPEVGRLVSELEEMVLDGRIPAGAGVAEFFEALEPLLPGIEI